LSFASFDFAAAFAALAFALAAASSRFCCFRWSFNSPLLIVPDGVAVAVVGAVVSAGAVVVCAPSMPASIAPDANAPNRFAIDKDLSMF
jgi:hypothetical protein